MSLNRRQFIQTTSIALCAGAKPLNLCAANKSTALPIPPLLESHRGQPLLLTLQTSHWSFNSSSNKVSVWGLNGIYLGPTVRVHNNDNAKFVFTNCLHEAVSMTVAGLQVPGILMGGARRVIPPGGNWSPVMPIRQGAATCWYHANTPNQMAQHVYNGLAGMCLINDEISSTLEIPNHYGIDDFPLILQDKRLTNFGFPEYTSTPEHGFLGDTLLTNGVQNPYLSVSRGWIRLRLLNASNTRRYELVMSDGRPFDVIASDLGFLPTPVKVQKLSLAPGERREIVVDMSQSSEVSITAGVAAGLIDRLCGLFGASDILISTTVLNLLSTGLLPVVTDKLPIRLVADQIPHLLPKRVREFRLGGARPGINGALWNQTRIDTQVQQGSFEIWIIHAVRPQSFHIAGVMFLVKRVNGTPPMAEDRGWKDTVWVDGYVELLVMFTQSSSEYFPFVYFSHMLEMADRGTAGQLQVLPAK